MYVNSRLKLTLALSIFVGMSTFAHESPESDTPNQTDIMQNNEIIPEQEEQENQKEPGAILHDFLLEALKQLDMIQRILTELSSMINDGQIPSVTEQTDALESIKDMINKIQKARNIQFEKINFQIVYFFLELNASLINHLEKAFEQGFTNLPRFNENFATKRSIPLEQDGELLHKMIKLNTKNLKRLDKNADKVGLSWYNIAYRQFDTYIITPSYKYSIPQNALGFSAVGGALTTLWWHFAYNSLPERLKNLYGPKIQWNHNGIVNTDELAGVGKYISYLWEYNTQLAATIPVFAIATLYLKNKWGKLWPEIQKKCEVLHNRLKGGAYLKKAHHLNDELLDIRFDDLVGLDEVKIYFQSLVDYLENPEQFDRLGLTPEKGCLLIGDTRTGKSYSVRALFTEIKNMLERTNRQGAFKFLECRIQLINRFGLSYILNAAKEDAPCIIFIDEIDLLDLQRKGENQKLMELLTIMSGALDGKDPKNQVIIIAATNQPETVDKSLRQYGRFGKEIRLLYPSFNERKEFMIRKLKKLSISSDLFDIDKIAHQTENQSYQGLEVLINYALFKARVRNEIIGQHHIDQALDEDLRHIMPMDGKDIPSHEKELLAIHFAGHALGLMLLNTDLKLAKVTIKRVMTSIKEEISGMHLFKEDQKTPQRYEYGEIFTYREKDSINVFTKNEKLNLIRFHLAGIAAEEIALGSASYSCHIDDMKHALMHAQSLAFEGLEPSKLPKHMQKERFDKAMGYIETCKKEIKAILEEHKQILGSISYILKEVETLSTEEIVEIIKFSLSMQNEQNKNSDDGLEQQSRIDNSAATAH